MPHHNFSHSRRRLMQGAASLIALPAAVIARAQPDASAWPRQPVRIVVGYPPGQTVDVTARAYGAALQQAWGQPVVVENMPGANGIIGARIVKSANPDGYTLLFGTSGQLAINPAIYAALPYAPLRDFAPVALGATGRLYLVANKSLPVSTLRELVAYAKAHPGKLTYGSGGVGITAHLAMELLKSATGMDALHVPYKGSPAALTGLIAGDVQLMFDAGSLVLPQIRSGKIKPLAVSSAERFSGLPAVATVAEQGVTAFDISTWSALVAPAGTPAAIVEKINAAMQAASRLPAVATPVRAGGSEPQQYSAARFGDFLRRETVLWADAAHRAGVKPE
ncbi:Bug family tripartite tricarboxylate transporter substrate binding protein [Cupriavidus alkaliphilus]|uniref:Tripartite-type tricarboxylate transporter receptor subunit TctC n=1 Tax=Cupriavidus alkaliphilus TaxID=942866 RepID=A0A7W4YUB6_9BURK|nr:tripartite tricarboxylate transporter substrate binding protein [Cupriavidus alkaliphilus]MBB3010081.1 tripartite-type tricarboxylate transporter receptor subunit TctC [Cupriavidus alkaliphilus]